jgi:hypothetical protein
LHFLEASDLVGMRGVQQQKPDDVLRVPVRERKDEQAPNECPTSTKGGFRPHS